MLCARALAVCQVDHYLGSFERLQLGLSEALPSQAGQVVLGEADGVA